MNLIHSKLSGWILLPILTGALLAAGCVHYEARTLDAADNLEALMGRSLSDPGLRRFIEANMSRTPTQWTQTSWDFQRLTLAALYFNPELAVAKAKLAEAEASRITAGERPNPVVGLSPGYNFSTPSGENISPWILGISFDVPLKTAGKRGLQIAVARHLSDAARMQLAGTAWEIRYNVKQAMIDLWAAGERAGLSRQKLAAVLALVRISEARYAAGDIDRSVLMNSRLLEQQARFESAEAGGESDKALIQLAVSAGLASHALDDVEIDFTGLETIPSEIPSAEARRSALLNRADILSALAAYAASESALQREIAGQYPDLSIGPGYEFDQGDNKWAIGFQLTVPVLNRNRGPIAEAEAKRQTAAAEFISLQSKILGDIESMMTAFQADCRKLKAADAILDQARQEAEVVEKQYAAGAVSKEALLSSQLEKISADSIRLDSRMKAQTSLGKLEYALQTPMDSTMLPAVISSEEK